MPKKFNISSFLKLSPEQQAREVEKLTKDALTRLPTLKKQLKMYGEVSDELYNLQSDELKLMGTSYAKAVRGGEISTPSSKKAYSKFIKDLHKYARTDIRQLAQETANKRMDSWLDNILASSTDEDKKYAQELFDSLTENEKQGFTRSKFFMDSTYMYMITIEDGREFSIQTLKLELYLEEVRGRETRHIYRNEVKKSEGALRKYRKRKKFVRADDPYGVYEDR